VPVEQYADTAFGANGYPSFGYGCAVFMQSDIVDFQRQGWKPEEIMAGLCNVLPKNIWLYVSQIPNLSPSAAASCCKAARSTTWPP
jgi:activator of 2-hydroxyglutaryl-CoA dehydratase